MPRLRTVTGDIVDVSAELAEQITGHGYKPVSGSRRRADTGSVPAQPAARPGREPEPTTAQLEQQLQSRRSRSSDQH